MVVNPAIVSRCFAALLAAGALAGTSPAKAQAVAAGAAHRASPGKGGATSHGIAGVWFINDKDPTKYKAGELQYRMGQLVDADEQAIKTAEGQPPPMQPWAAALLAKRISDARAGHAHAAAKARCLPGALPQIMYGPKTEPIKIIEEPDVVTVLIESTGSFRQIYMNVPHSADPDPTYMGESVGRWEGDTLVVDTIGFNDETALDGVGSPHTEALHIVERFRRVDQGSLELAMTIDDPKTFTRSWSLAPRTLRLVRGERLTEFVCDNQRNSPDRNGNISFSHGPAEAGR